MSTHYIDFYAEISLSKILLNIKYHQIPTLSVPLMFAFQGSRMRVLDRAVEFHIQKKGEEVWPRLTEKQLRLPWLKIDFDKFAFEDEDEEQQEEGMSEKLAQEEMMRQLEEDLMKDTPGGITVKY